MKGRLRVGHGSIALLISYFNVMALNGMKVKADWSWQTLKFGMNLSKLIEDLQIGMENNFPTTINDAIVSHFKMVEMMKIEVKVGPLA